MAFSLSCEIIISLNSFLTENLGFEELFFKYFVMCERHSELHKRDVYPFETDTNGSHSSSLTFLLTGQLTECDRPNFLILLLNNHIPRRNSRFLTISLLRREPSLTRTLKWPGRSRAQITCTHRALIMCNILCYMPRGRKGQLSC